MDDIDLPKRADGTFLDLYANIYKDDKQELLQYAKKVKEAYKIDEFELKTESHGILKFHRDRVILDTDILKDCIMYDLFDENTEYLVGKPAGVIQIHKNSKEFGIQIVYQDDSLLIERRGLATEIWKKAKQIMKIIGIEDYMDYEIFTFVPEATEHLRKKYGNPFREEKKGKIVSKKKEDNSITPKDDGAR